MTPNFSGSSQGWVDRTYIVKVPAHAHLFQFMPFLMRPASARWTWPVRGTGGNGRATAETDRDSIDHDRPTINPSSLPPELHVVGNQLQTPGGKAVWLQGFAWTACNGPPRRAHRSVHPGCHREVKANCIRLPVMENFWPTRSMQDRNEGHEVPKDCGRCRGGRRQSRRIWWWICTSSARRCPSTSSSGKMWRRVTRTTLPCSSSIQRAARYFLEAVA